MNTMSLPAKYYSELCRVVRTAGDVEGGRGARLTSDLLGEAWGARRDRGRPPSCSETLKDPWWRAASAEPCWRTCWEGHPSLG
ncbi:unnamed protein product [Gadus morhua 'NCC']